MTTHAQLEAVGDDHCTLRVSGTTGALFQELRISFNGGGPGYIELVVSVDEDGSSIAVWNPLRNEWSHTNLTGLGVARA